MVKQGFVVGLWLAVNLLTFGQGDFFSNYKPMAARGNMPEDFRIQTNQKIDSENQLDGLDKKVSTEFLEQVHYGIDEILRSGKVLYGDPLTAYVERVGSKITQLDSSMSSIRFYTLRSNVVNAFSTRQGIIFVTQGLLAQLANEAQLAFVLSHELAHYLKDHVIEGFKENVELRKSRNSQESKIKQLSVYSKEKELEADKIGLELYKKAGYAKSQLDQVFDVLLYSYLPFELRELPHNYWNDDYLVIPDSYFATDFPKISVDEDFDDSKSSHPNIQSRREQLQQFAATLEDWQTDVFSFPKEDFYVARNIARFESLRNDLLNFRYGDVLYGAFLLESEFPNNRFIENCKAKAWAGLLAFKVSGNFTQVTVFPDLIQGEPFQLHQLLRRLSKEQLYALALRQVALAVSRFPEDEEIRAVYKYSITQLAKDENFSTDDFQKIGFTEAQSQYEKLRDELKKEHADSTHDDSNAADKTISKYDKIRKTKESQSEVSEDDFHLYALADILFDPEFDQIFLSARELLKNEREKERDFAAQSFYKRQKLLEKEQENRLLLGLKDIIVLEPRAVKIVKGNQLDPKRSEQLEVKLREVMEYVQHKSHQQMNVHKLGFLEFKENGTSMYNQKAILLNALEHMIAFDRQDLFPVDYQELRQISTQFGTSKVCFALIQSQNIPPSISRIVGASVIPIVWIYAAPLTVMTAYLTSFNAVVFDIDSYDFDAFAYYSLNGTTNKLLIESVLSDFFLKLGSLPEMAND
jgi:beta-barrel assembly-enhancing protease